ncbi:DET1 homolog isoform X1 [Drosophila subobscura]|uniref:DET1 homolog isoform X1 n=1 Tax=Drosophila subobscura TaxID=7241 RepID=UPI00155B3772|nr:DET1 homolog isoform X1 [Drosophila subobscura]
MSVMTAYSQRLQSQNLVHMLQNRESCYTRIGSKLNQSPYLSYERGFYKCITPCLTIDSVEIPPVFLRKFTPDGSKLLAFSLDQRSLHVYKYKGFGATGVGELIRETDVGEVECYMGGNRVPGSTLKYTIFDRLFATNDVRILRLCQGDYWRFYLHREFSVFLENGRYVLLAAMSILHGALATADYVSYPDLFDKLDAFSYIFFVVDLELGVVTDTLFLPQDSIVIAHNHGISVHESSIAIMSKLYQCIYLYELVDGRLVKRETIGPRPRGFIDEGPLDMGVLDANTILPITHIKQRVLSFLYRKIDSTSSRSSKKYQDFYKNFDFLEHMIMEKLQLVNRDLILLRFEERPKDNETAPLLPLGEIHTPRRFYVFYTILDEQVVGAYQDDSVELLQIILQFYDQMRNVRSQHTGDAPSLPPQFFLKQNFVDANKTIPFMRQAALRFNPSVPVSTQSFSPTPYLKYNEFSYDDRLISPLERPKPCSADPIVFRDRSTKLVKFRLSAKARTPNNPLAPRELCAFICHPFEPLILSIQKYLHNYAYNIHLYNQSTVVRNESA